MIVSFAERKVQRKEKLLKNYVFDWKERKVHVKYKLSTFLLFKKVK